MRSILLGSVCAATLLAAACSSNTEQPQNMAAGTTLPASPTTTSTAYGANVATAPANAMPPQKMGSSNWEATKGTYEAIP